MCHNGDGTHAREVFHGGMNFASLHKLPVIFICENNGYGISASFEEDHAVEKYLAERAAGYCIPGYVVDGNDVLAVKKTVEEAVERARNGEGPTFIECRVHRQRGHFEGDPVTYIDKEIVEKWIRDEDPIKLFKEKLLKANIATEDELQNIYDEEDAGAKAAIAEAEKSPLPPPDRIYQGLFNEEEVR